MEVRKVIIGLLLTSAIGSSANAQSSDPVVDRIVRLGMDSSRVEQLSQSLLDSIGPRLTGTPSHTAASNFVIDTYRKWGVEARRESYGTWRGWKRGTSHIDLVSPRVRSLEGTMLAWSPGTRKPVSAEAIILPKFADSSEFVKWLPKAKGKIVLVSPALPTCRPSEDWVRFATPASRAKMDSAVALTLRDWAVMTKPDNTIDSARMYRGTGYVLGLGTGSLGLRMEKAGIAGMISSRTKLRFSDPFRAATTATTTGSGGWGSIEIFETYNTRAPAVTLSCEDYSLVYRLADRGQKPVVRLDLSAELLGEVPSFNTLATIKGIEKPDEYVMLSAHFDSWDGSSGATDNGTGTVMAMEAMRLLTLAYPKPKRTIIAGHWGGEEQGLNGSRAFAEDHPEIMKGLQGLFNQDDGTGRIQSIIAGGLTAIGPHLRDWHSKLPSLFRDSLSANAVAWRFHDRPPGNASGTDGAVFACYATPSFGFDVVGWNYGSYTWHTNRDTYDKIVFDDLRHNATVAALMVYFASEDPAFISRVKSPGTWAANWPANCGKAARKTKPRY